MKLSPELFEKFAQILEKYDLAEINFEEEDCQLHIVRKHEAQASVGMPMGMSMPMMAPALPANVPAALPPVSGEAPKVDENFELIKAPIVGTAYLAPEPGAPMFIKVGDKVEKDQVILIIEAMKVMNQLKSPVSGVVKEILTANAKPVEFGEVLIKIQKA